MSQRINDIRAYAAFSLTLLQFWTINWLIGPTFDEMNEVVSRLTLGVFFLLITVLAEYKPIVFKATRFNLIAVALGTATAVLLFFFGSALAVLPKFLLGCMYMLSFCYVSCYGHLSLIAARKSTALVVIALAYITVHFAQPFIPLLPLAGQLILAACLPLLTYLVAQPSTAPTLAGYTPNTTPADLSIENPNSFMPFSNRFFLAVFLFGLVFGFAVCNITPAELMAEWASCFVPLIILVIGYALTRKPLDSDTLFYAATLFLVAGLLLSLGQRAFPPLSLTATGSELFDLFFYWFAIVQVGSKNQLAVLPVLAWGRCASSLGSACGVAIGFWASIPPATTLPFVTCVITFLFVVFLIGRPDRFDFNALAETIEPVATPLPDKDSEKAPAGPVVDGPGIEAIALRYGLTDRERDVFMLLARGRSGSYIQEQLFITKNTTKTHVRNIYAKLGVHSKQELIDLVDKALES